jgi:hypothetical protein
LFIPEYLIAPYLLTDEPEFSNPAQPQLDRIGSKVMLTALHLLLPYYKGEKINP